MASSLELRGKGPAFREWTLYGDDGHDTSSRHGWWRCIRHQRQLQGHDRRRGAEAGSHHRIVPARFSRLERSSCEEHARAERVRELRGDHERGGVVGLRGERGVGSAGRHAGGGEGDEEEDGRERDSGGAEEDPEADDGLAETVV